MGETVKKRKNIKRIVITGALEPDQSLLYQSLLQATEMLHYRVILVSDRPVEMQQSGWIAAYAARDQEAIRTAQQCDEGKVLIIYETGIPDSRFVLSDEAYKAELAAQNTNEVNARDQYDGAFLITDFVYEREKSCRLLQYWTGQPHLRVIPKDPNIRKTGNRLKEEVLCLLGDPKPIEIERKYLIRYPDIALLMRMPECTCIRIQQSYVRGRGGNTVRLRQRGQDGNYLYYETRKLELTPLKHIESERRITEEEYHRQLNEADFNRTICKNRYCVVFDEQYFEIDVYPFWKDKAIMEIELCREDQPVRIPEYIRVIEEVTQNRMYRNSALAQRYGSFHQ